MKFCSNCGSAVLDFRVPPGDTLPRQVCSVCATIHYVNPKIVVGCLPEWEGQVLLCKRAIDPRRGLWTLPAGFLENGETLADGALRETLEEAHARVDIGKLLPRGRSFGTCRVIKPHKKIAGRNRHGPLVEPVLFFLAKTLHFGKDEISAPSELKIRPLPQGNLPAIAQEHQRRHAFAKQIRQCLRIAGVVQQPRFILIQSVSPRASESNNVLADIHHRAQDNMHASTPLQQWTD